MNGNSSKLPAGCGELEATARPSDEMLLEDHIDDLPGITKGRVNQLSRVALRAQGGSWGRGPGATVLHVNDLVRETHDEQIALHPRVTQCVPLSSIDPLLKAIPPLFDERLPGTAHQHPDAAIECRGGTPDPDTLYPPEYDIRLADLARKLRAGYMVTSIRSPGESRLPIEERRSVVRELAREGVSIKGSVTVHQPSDASQPKLYVDRFTTKQDPPSVEDLQGIFSFAAHRCGINPEVVEDSDWGESSLTAYK